jgi:hypothetical protein
MSCPDTIDAIFAKRATPAEAHALYEHMEGCADCRAEYERHLLFESLLPREEKVSAEDRIRQTLPLVRSLPSRRWIAVASMVAAAACFFLFMRRPAADDNAFHARGVGTTTAGPAFEVYRLNGGSERATSITKDDELAFAYTNPNGAHYLLIFAVDEGRHFYWYYPAWTNAAEEPSALAIKPASSLVELGEGIRHDIVGKQLRVYAVWSDSAMTTREAESKFPSAGMPETIGWSNTTETSRLLEVR